MIMLKIKKMAWRQLWHLGPQLPEKHLNKIITQFKDLQNFSFEIIDTWHAKDYGKRIPRKSLIMQGVLNPGSHLLKIELVI